MNMSPGPPFLAAALLAASAEARNDVWVVDAAGASGADYTALQPALDAAADGDVVLVRPGSYEISALVDARSLTIAADGPLVTVTGFLAVRNLAADDHVTLRGLQLGYGAALNHRDNEGVVWIEDCTILGSVWALHSRLVLQDSSVSQSVPTGHEAQPAMPAVRLIDSVMAMSGGRLRGGDEAHVLILWQAAPGAMLSGSTLELSGVEVEGGDGALLPGGAGIEAVNGSVVTLHSTTLQGGAGNPAGAPLSSDPSSTVLSFPGLAHGLATSSPTRFGEDFTLALTGSRGDAAWILFSLRPVALPVLPAMLLVDPAALFHTAFLGVVGPSGTLGASFPVPGNGAAEGLELFLQDLYFDFAHGVVRLGPGSAPLLLDAGF